MRLSYDPRKTSAWFDDPNLVSRAGLVPVMGLAERAGLFALAGEQVSVGGPCGASAAVKIGCLVAGMAAEAGTRGEPTRRSGGAWAHGEALLISSLSHSRGVSTTFVFDKIDSMVVRCIKLGGWRGQRSALSCHGLRTT